MPLDSCMITSLLAHARIELLENGMMEIREVTKAITEARDSLRPK